MSDRRTQAKVYHADAWSLREHKYAWLEEHEWRTTDWKVLRPAPEYHLFVPRDITLEKTYNRFVKVTDVFSAYSVGIATARDRLTIHWTAEEAWATVLSFSRLDPDLAREAYALGPDVRDWKVSLAQEDLRQSGPSRDRVTRILYRPFDVRYTYYTGKTRGFHCMPRPEIMRNMLSGENLGLITSRLTKGETFKHVQITTYPSEVICMSPKTSNNGFLFPLYVHEKGRRGQLFNAQTTELIPNLSDLVANGLREAYEKEVDPEEILYYVYALLHGPSYREAYADFLRLDFPRIPFTSDVELFQELAELGERLVELHLLRSPELDAPIARFQGEGAGKVVTSGKKGLRYDADSRRVYINQSQYFEGVPPEVWAYRIGGYQVCHKWLKDRKDRTLTLDEIRTYCRIATALSKTIEIQSEIDELYPEVEQHLLSFDDNRA